MSEGIGELLKKAREEKGLKLEAIAKETKIQLRYLEALEKEEFSVMPGETYLKGFLKNYAAAVGLNSKEIVEKYEKQTKVEYVEDREIDEEIVENENKSSMFKTTLIAFLILLAFYIAVNLLKMVGNQTENKKPTVNEHIKLEEKKPVEEKVEQKERKEFEVKKIEFKKLTIKANSRVWLEIRDGGKKQFVGYLEKNKTVDIKSKNKILVKASQANRIEIIFNGENLGSLGEGEKFWKEF